MEDIILILILILMLVPILLEIRKVKPNAYWENVIKKNTMRNESKQDSDKQ